MTSRPPAADQERRDRIIASLLWYGTWLASAVIAAGMIMEALGRHIAALVPDAGGHTLVRAGVVLFILLPIARVALMVAIFLRERDYAYGAISALVLAVILAGIVAGL